MKTFSTFPTETSRVQPSYWRGRRRMVPCVHSKSRQSALRPSPRGTVRKGALGSNMAIVGVPMTAAKCIGQEALQTRREMRQSTPFEPGYVEAAPNHQQRRR